MSSVAEASVVAAARGGDRYAFDAIMQHYQARIARYIRRLVHDPELALDLTQDTFVEAFRGIHNLRSDLALGAWLYRIATHRAMRAYRRGSAVRWHPLSDYEDSSEVACEAPEDGVMDREQVTAALSHISRERVACLLLNAVEGFSYVEVAAIVGTTPEAVRKRVARAKEQFRAVYDLAGAEADKGAARHAVR